MVKKEHIWEKELSQDLSFPDEWVREWQYCGVPLPSKDSKLPPERGRQCNALRLITGTKYKNMIIKRLSKFVTKPCFLLIDNIQAVGDFGQHKMNQFSDVKLSLGFVVSFCLSAIELCENLNIDLNS